MHPSVKIFIYFVILLTMGFLQQQFFLIFFTFTIALVSVVQKQKFLLQCLRLKWFFLSIFIVYAFGTPGEYVSNFAWEYLPTKEGIFFGAMQVAKLLLALALLGILFHRTHPETMMVGLQTLLSPLRVFKIDVSRFIVRLMLTLDYVNQLSMLKLDRKNFFELFNQVQEENPFPPSKNLCISAISFNYIDVLALFSVFFYLWFIVRGVQV